jgi:thymidylate kinase/thiamine kinase-like enzyme
MEPKFNILEYNLSRNLGNGTPVDLLVINNPDGSPRWFLPAHATKPHFLMFYHVGSLRSRAYAWIMELLFAVRLQHVLLKKERWYFHLKNTQTEPSFDILRDAWSLFTGTVGPNNKFVLYTQIAGNGFFWKLANTPTAVSLIDDEICAVNVLNSLKISTFEYPAMIKTSKNSLKMNQVGENGKRVNAFGKPHQRALAEIMDTSLEVRPLQTIFGFEQAMENIRRFRESPDSRIPNGLVQKLEYMFGCNQEKNVFCAYSHGDFTPWNLVVSDEQLSMFDLELAGVRPLGFDAFHFVVQKGILSERKSWSAIRREIEENIVPWLQPLVAETGKDWQYYLRLYLLINTAAHIGLYGRQPNWHTQVNWLLQTWNEALSDVLSDELSQRGMMIADLFSFLHPHPYAAVKFPDINPSELDPYADIDLITPKDLVPNILHLMKSHPLTASVQAQHKTFMSSVQIILKDASILNVDLIWDLKRKNLQMMEAGQVLLRAEVNVHGVKIMHPDDLADYLVLFYGLNGQAVPEKYRAYLSKTHPQSRLDSQHAHHRQSRLDSQHAHHPQSRLDSQDPGAQPFGNPEAATLKKLLRQRSANRGLSALRNTLAYFYDTIRSYFGPSGFTITFSGVDGAGKSTVIELVRHEVEKKLRKRVVVLRHRPSILPILSAWTKGKVRAEQQAAATLPRLGGNKNQLSSLVRFVYYYSDYLIGQFVIWALHIRRGDIVLYDRYYFDFINDSVRSNITLPPSLLRAGYQFLLQPELNFFLYADPDTILSRKQELDRTTIGMLTERYLTLFSELNSKNAQSSYIPLENRYLQETIHTVFTKIRHQAA